MFSADPVKRANAGAPTDVTSQQYPSAPLMQMLTSARQQEDEARLTIVTSSSLMH